jgi:hypothetical protein
LTVLWEYFGSVWFNWSKQHKPGLKPGPEGHIGVSGLLLVRGCVVNYDGVDVGVNPDVILVWMNKASPTVGQWEGGERKKGRFVSGKMGRAGAFLSIKVLLVLMRRKIPG